MNIHIYKACGFSTLGAILRKGPSSKEWIKSRHCKTHHILPSNYIFTSFLILLLLISFSSFFYRQSTCATHPRQNRFTAHTISATRTPAGSNLPLWTPLGQSTRLPLVCHWLPADQLRKLHGWFGCWRRNTSEIVDGRNCITHGNETSPGLWRTMPTGFITAGGHGLLLNSLDSF